MVVQAIALLDDLDKEINIYSMRVKVCADIPGFRASHVDVRLGMVRLAFPGDGKNFVGQLGICQGGEIDGYEGYPCFRYAPSILR